MVFEQYLLARTECGYSGRFMTVLRNLPFTAVATAPVTRPIPTDPTLLSHRLP